jgi:acyl-CoA synthetase (AMP-forming)/AMP-acid ligase II
MIGRLLSERLIRDPEQIALIHQGIQVSYGDIGRLLTSLVEGWGKFAGKRVGVCTSSPMAFVAAVGALDLVRSHAFLIGLRSREELARLNEIFAWDYIIREEDVLAVSAAKDSSLGDSSVGSGLVTILTSGTTGTPKAVNHTWTTLASPVRKEKRYAGTRWLLTYPLNLYAGTQVFLQAVINRATLVIPASLDPIGVCRALKENWVTHASGTPTFWRQLVYFGHKGALQACELDQITIGGEVVTQELLDNLRIKFPRARIVHIYASTELGRIFSVTDGREGFPAKILEEPPEEGIALRIVNGELMARGRNAMISYDRQKPLCEQSDGWMATGDLVEVLGDRVVFIGRRKDVINVGGRKVSPLQVEATLRGLPGIIDVRVYAKKSSLTGHLVAADVVLAPGVCEATIGAELRQAASRTLQPHEVPRIVRVVPKMAINEALKIVRSEEAE